MSTTQFQCTLSTPTNAPLYKTYRGLGFTLIELSMDIADNVSLIHSLGIRIQNYKQPTIDELYDCWMYGKELVYTIECINSQYNVEFRLTAKHS